MQQVLDWMHNNSADLINYVVYGAIAIVTLIGVFKCLLPLMGTTHALRRAIRRLQDEAGQKRDVPVWQENRFMGNRLKGSWLRFLQNAEQLDRRGLPCNVEDYINDDTVTHGPGNATLAELIPSLLTSLGILGTFMGMTSGLSGLDASSMDGMMDGINMLLSGMQFAFGTSVAGVSCSLLFNMLNRILQGSSYRAIDDFVECFTQLAMQRPLDNDVQLICQNQDRNHLLGTVTDTFATQMGNSIERAVGRAMQPIAQSMDHFLIGATRAQIDGVAHIVNQFVDQMNTSLNNQFLVMGQTLTDINQQQQVSYAQLQNGILSAGQILQDVERLHGVSRDVISHFEHYVEELSLNRQRDEHFEASASDLLSRMRQANEQQVNTIARLQSCQEDLNRSMTQFTQLSRDSLSLVRQGNEDSKEQLARVAKSMQGASQELSNSYEGFVQNVVEGLSRALGMFEQNMQTLVAALGEKINTIQKTGDGTDGSLAKEIGEVQRMLRDVKESLDQAGTRAADEEA